MLNLLTETFVRLIPTDAPDGPAEGETLALACVPAESVMRTEDGIPAVRRRVLLLGEAPLRPEDRLRRVSDGKVLRVTGDSAHFRAPAGALHPVGQAEAEVIPDD